MNCLKISSGFSLFCTYFKMDLNTILKFYMSNRFFFKFYDENGGADGCMIWQNLFATISVHNSQKEASEVHEVYIFLSISVWLPVCPFTCPPLCLCNVCGRNNAAKYIHFWLASNSESRPYVLLVIFKISFRKRGTEGCKLLLFSCHSFFHI